MRFLPLLPLLFAANLSATIINPDSLLSAAKSQIGITLSYDDSYKSIKYPNGDFSILTGCCTDVLIRSYRKYEVDLQQLVHTDITSHFESYSKLLTNRKPDKNIDHRRVAVLQVFFSRNAKSLPVTQNPTDYSKGDIVIWRLPSGRLHIGFVSDIKNQGSPMVIHNIGYGVRSDDVLFRWKLIGHYRYLLPNA